MNYPAGVVPNYDKKFDMQLTASLVHERRLANIFAAYKIEKIELKSESHQWEKTGNICIELAYRGQPSGIAATKADYWVHELLRDGKTLCYLMFPRPRLQELVLDAHAKGQWRTMAGDGGKSTVVLIKLRDILK